MFTTEIVSYKMHDYIYPENEVTTFLFADILYYCFIPFVYIGNLFTIVLLSIVFRKRRKPADLIVAFLSLNDFFLGVFLCTPTLVATGKGEWPGRTFCYIYAHLYSWHMNVKFFVVIMIAVDRYIAIVKPFQYVIIVTESKISKIIISYILIFGVVVGAVFLVTEPYLMPGWFCTPRLWKETFSPNETEHHGTESQTALIVCYCGLIIYGSVGISVMLFCNFSVFRVFRKKIHLANSEKRFMHMMIVIVIAFLAVWIPHAMTVLVCFNFHEWCPFAFYIIYRLIVVSAGWNPFIYCIVKPGYRKGYWILIKKCLHVLSCGLYASQTENETISQLIRNDIAPHAFIHQQRLAKEYNQPTSFGDTQYTVDVKTESRSASTHKSGVQSVCSSNVTKTSQLDDATTNCASSDKVPKDGCIFKNKRASTPDYAQYLTLLKKRMLSKKNLPNVRTINVMPVNDTIDLENVGS